MCGGCGKAGWRWCPDCQRRVRRVVEPLCGKCGIPVRIAGLCEKCRANPPAYRALRSWAVFDSPVRSALHRMKYRRDLGLGDTLAAHLVDYVHSLNWPVEMLIPIPLGKVRLKERGYNQVALVGRPLAHLLGLFYSPGVLRKTRETHTQVGLSVSERQENVHHAFKADPESVKRKIILVMDDVATTGSTLSSATDALLSAGAREVYAMTLARALSHHSLDSV